MIKVITFQHRAVVEELQSLGVYSCTYKGEYHKNTPNSYQFLSEHFNNKCKGVPMTYPIFGWSQVLEVGLEVDESNPRDIDRMMGMTGFDEPYYMIVLRVPKDKVMETDFYGFVDLRCSEEFPHEDPPLTEIGKANILKPRENDIIEIQAILGYIDMDWVESITDIKNIRG